MELITCNLTDGKFVGIIGLNLQGETKKKYRYFF